MRQRRSGERASRWARWGSALLGAWVLACGALPEERLPEAVGEEEATLQASSYFRPFPVSRPILEETPTARAGPSVAFDGELFFVVWRDDRTGGVFGSRVTPGGTRLDPAGIALNLGSGVSGGEPRVAYDGTQFLVVWESSDGVYGSHVRRDGTIVRAGFEIISTGESSGPPGLACAKGVCLVCYGVSGDEENVIAGKRVESDGDVIDLPESISDPEIGRYSFDPAVAWDGSQFLVVWSDTRGGEDTPDLYAARLRRDGTQLDPGGVPLIAAPGAQLTADLTWTGRRFLVVWAHRLGADLDIRGARVRPDLRVEEPTGFPIATGEGDQGNPRVAPSGAKSLVVWDDSRSGALRVRGARVGDDGVVRDPAGFAISSGEFPQELLPAVAAGDGRFFVAFAGMEGDDPFGPRHVLGTRVMHDTTVRDSPALRFTRSANRQESAAAAYGGGRYLVVWREWEDGTPRLLATRVSLNGRTSGVPLRLPASPEARAPAVAFDGESFLVVWEEPGAGDGRSDILGARVSPSGGLLDATPLAIAALEEGQSEPAVASSGEGFLVVWVDERGGSFGDVSDIYGARVSSAGAVLDSGGFRISGIAHTQDLPAVVYAGGHYFVAWRHFAFTPIPFSEESLRGARVAVDGTVLDRPELLIDPGPIFPAPPALSFDGANVLVAWTGGFDAPGVYAVRVDGGGGILDSPALSVATGGSLNRMRLTATFDGTDHWLVWEVSDGFIPEDHRTDLYGTRIRPDGTVRDPGGRPIAASRGAPEFDPVLVSSGAGHTTVFYTAFVVEPTVGNLRILGLELR